MRDNLWLTQRLINLHQMYFPDITDGNEIEVRFGRTSKTRLGSIVIREKGFKHRRLERRRLQALSGDQAISIITINGHLTNPNIPEKLVDGILVHEFCHYVHGFNSLRPKQYKMPHHGGIINAELKQRGLEEVLKFQKKWLKENWKNVVSIK